MVILAAVEFVIGLAALWYGSRRFRSLFGPAGYWIGLFWVIFGAALCTLAVIRLFD